MESYIYHDEDILSLKVEIENAWLDVWLDQKIEELLDNYVLHTKYSRVLRVSSPSRKTEDATVTKMMKSSYFATPVR